MAVKNPFLAREVKYFKGNGEFIKYEYKGHTFIMNKALCIRVDDVENLRWLSGKLGKEPVVVDSSYVVRFTDSLDLENGYEVKPNDFTLTEIAISWTKFKGSEVNYTLYGKNYSTLFNSDYVMTLFHFSDKVMVTADKYKTVILCGLDKDNVLTGFCFPVQSDKHTHRLKKFVRG